jgi:hypothetical protein
MKLPDIDHAALDLILVVDPPDKPLSLVRADGPAVTTVGAPMGNLQ